ncbi:LuxR C-terminal-related transcriptional regulator [Geodermatophilus sabuli]|uniref:LuxR C-terminal-related transcriptional regulator n=1 Tax=Geodermatophilus sabuli TaxID=1564158 RepID=UPI000BE2FC65|nr:LuxR C-terminal-related transcriptional regulator [Geodermatophilus sabuli]MBB3085409.1 LuxR family maltose regulon positive regulatory protein [Geodermatophilus sabuli]
MLESKLAPPPLGFPPVPRPRLLTLLTRRVAATPVTLVSGPAGAGKTVLAASWLRAQGDRQHVAWLSLEESDNAPAAFWAHVAAALRHAGIELPEPVAPGPGEHAPTPQTRLASVLLARPRPLVLILDNADCLTHRDLIGGLDLLVRYAGTRLRLVLCARADPPLPLHRYRLTDALTEIRADRLAFTAEETGVLLAALGAPVPEDIAAALCAATEGWAVALRLAAALLTRGTPPEQLVAALVDDDGGVAQYLSAEVLTRQPAAVRRFLLRISVTDQLWPDLLERLTGRHPSTRVLASLAAANAFVERAIGAAGGYRIHALFRELLQAQLAYEDPGAFTALHRACAGWYAAAGDLPRAVAHAGAAGDRELTARLLIDDLAVAGLLADGTAAESVPTGAGGPDAAVLRAAASLGSGVAAAAADLTLAAAAAVDTQTRSALRVAAAVTCAAAAAGPADDDVQAAAAHAESLLAEVPEEQEPRRAALGAVLAAERATALLHTDASDDTLLDAFRGALTATTTADAGSRLRARCLADLALLEALAGRLSQAAELVSDYEALAEQHLLPEARREGAAATAAAWTCLERHELGDARRWLGRAQGRPADAAGTGALRVVLHSRLQRARGDLDAADQALQPALDLPAVPRWVREQVVAEAARVRLARRDGPGSRRLVGRLPAASPRAAVLRATAAALGLGEESPGPVAIRSGRLSPVLAVEDAVVRTCLLAATSDVSGAVATLELALRLAAPERLRRPFLDAPPQLRPLLRTHPALTAAGSWLDPTAAPAPTPQRPAEGSGLPRTPAPAPPLVGELSARELEVLEHIAAMLSTAEIAAALFISVNTVRTHIRSILRKLAVPGRAAAVRRARQLGIL